MSTVWTKTEAGNGYCTDASDLEGYLNQTGSDPCPGCGDAIQSGRYSRIRDDEGDIVRWEQKHACGTLLVVFND